MPGRSLNGGVQPAATASAAAALPTTSRCTGVSRGGHDPDRARNHSYHPSRATRETRRESASAASRVRRNCHAAARVGVNTAATARGSLANVTTVSVIACRKVRSVGTRSSRVSRGVIN